MLVTLTTRQRWWSIQWNKWNYWQHFCCDSVPWIVCSLFPWSVTRDIDCGILNVFFSLSSVSIYSAFAQCAILILTLIQLLSSRNCFYSNRIIQLLNHLRRLSQTTMRHSPRTASQSEHVKLRWKSSSTRSNWAPENQINIEKTTTHLAIEQ